MRGEEIEREPETTARVQHHVHRRGRRKVMPQAIDGGTRPNVLRIVAGRSGRLSRAALTSRGDAVHIDGRRRQKRRSRVGVRMGEVRVGRRATAVAGLRATNTARHFSRRRLGARHARLNGSRHRQKHAPDRREGDHRATQAWTEDGHDGSRKCEDGANLDRGFEATTTRRRRTDCFYLDSIPRSPEGNRCVRIFIR